MVRSLHRACSRCKAEASSGLTTRKEISTPLGRVSVWSLFMPIILYPWCPLVSLLPRKGCSRDFGCRGFAEVRQDEERGATLEKKRAGAFTLRPSSFPLEGALVRSS